VTRAWERKLRAFQEESESVNEEEMILSGELEQFRPRDVLGENASDADLAEYHVPVNADAPSVEAILVHEDDPHINALGVKGVGEIGITGTVGAIANAVWHATGVRVRRFPIHFEDAASAA